MHESQLEAWFDQVLAAMQRRTVFINQGDDPVFFLVYPPRWSLQVYGLLPTWERKLRHRGFQPHTFNVGLRLLDFLSNHPDWHLIVDYDRENPDETEAVNESVVQLLHPHDGPSVVETWVTEQVRQATEASQGVLLITGVELLHPYLQIGRIEQRLQGRFSVPTIVFYPGLRAGTFGLRFLGIYPPDGNYRSRHFGGTRT